jgi:hypothetical protein
MNDSTKSSLWQIFWPVFWLIFAIIVAFVVAAFSTKKMSELVIEATIDVGKKLEAVNRDNKNMEDKMNRVVPDVKSMNLSYF